MASGQAQYSSSILDWLQSFVPRCLRGDRKHQVMTHTLYDKDDLNRLLQDFTSQDQPALLPWPPTREQYLPEAGDWGRMDANDNEQLAVLIDQLDDAFDAPVVVDHSERILRLDFRRFLGFDVHSSLLAARVISGG